MATLVERISLLCASIREKFNTIAPRLLPEGGVIGQVPVKTEGGAAWADMPSGDSTTAGRIRNVVLFADVFEGSSMDGFSATSISGSVNSAVGVVTNAIMGRRYGVSMLTSGAAANTGYSYAAIAGNKFLSSGGETVRVAVYIPAATLGDSSFRFGLNAQWNNTDSNNETAMRVVAGVVTGRSSSDGLTTLVSVGELIGDTWYILEMICNSDSTACACNIRGEDNTLIATATINSNINKTARRNVVFSATSTTAGAKNIVALDYIYAVIPTNRFGD